MKNRIFKNITAILERDAKSTSYKFALLRAVIDISLDNSPFIKSSEKRIEIPMGLLIEKWILYYYPLFEAKRNIPQISGRNKLSFQDELIELIEIYQKKGGLSKFYNDLRGSGIHSNDQQVVFNLAKKMKRTITGMPMKHIGYSITNEYYSIFNYEKNIRTREFENLEKLVDQFGKFSIPKEYYQGFKLFGSFINGYDSVLFKWAEDSVNRSNKELSISYVLDNILKRPVTNRDVAASKKLYKKLLKDKGKVACVWTDRKGTNYDIDHIIPFSIWKNNDLWNLMPSDSQVNGNKKDKVPSPLIINRQKDKIIYYWELCAKSKYEKRFFQELKVSLIGEQSMSNWKSIAFSQLKNNCDYLINERGYVSWKA